MAPPRATDASSALLEPLEPRDGAWWRDGRAVLRDVVGTVRLVASVDPWLLGLEVGAGLAQAGGNVALAWVGKRIIDAVVDASRGAHPPTAALRWVLLELCIAVLLAGLEQLRAFVGGVLLRSRLGLEVNLRILEKAANVGYARFEDPEFINKMTQARREASARPLGMVTACLNLLTQGASLAGFVALLWSLGPWSLLALVVSAVPPFVFELRYGRAAYELQRARTQRNRQAFYLEAVLTTEQSAREVKLFALGRWLIGRYRALHEEFHREERSLWGRRARALFAVRALSAGVFYGVFVVVVGRAAAGALTLGAMTLYLTVFRQGQSALDSALRSLTRLYEDHLYMSNLFAFLAVPEDEPDEPLEPAGSAPEGPPEVRFEGVSFRYPGSDRDVLQEVSLTLRAGETVALVGRNGAGKTTLVKLLTGLYRPTAGRILLDGVDVATLSPGALRRRVGVILQDFVRYQFSAGDNIGVGWLPAREDPAALAGAVSDAGAEAVVSRLPKGLATPLGRAFGGDDLSVGQWQRVALARAFMRKSGVLVLDEPTASLDAEGEHEVFLRLRDLKRGRTALLITHRFSTVRMADRIVVLEEGRVTEEGPHAELLARGGAYAAMFNLQAEGYRG
jgi:ABC-type multidrug transport system fused ATPase/permease subunit